MNRLFLVVPALVAALLGCASGPTEPYRAVAADAATTAVGLSAPGIAEANPLGWATVPLRIFLIEQARQMPEAQGKPRLHALTAASYGAALSNLLVLSGAPVLLGPLAGLALAAYLWREGETEREFARLCEVHRSYQSQLRCEWTAVSMK